MSADSRRGLRLAALWALVAGGGLLARPAWPIDETRYLAVAWDMWTRGDLLVPHLNGIPYSDKPPLLFWLINAGWAAFGVHEWVGRLVPSLFALASLFLTARLARKLWPDRPSVAAAAPLLLLATFLWSFYTTVLLFDMLLVFFTLVGILGLVRVAKGERGGWSLVIAAIGLGILSKGPAILLWLAPAAVALPWWWPGETTRPRRLYPRAAGALAAGIALALAWAIPAALSGGRAYADAILWGQTAGRVTNAFAHRRPVWWYLPFVPLLFFPWLLWSRVGRRRFQAAAAESGIRLAAVWAISGLVLFSLVSGKQIHYLLPMLPAIALVGARIFAAGENPVTRPELAAVGTCFFLLAAVFASGRLIEDLFGLPSWVADLPPAAGAALAGLGLLVLVWRPRSRLASLELLSAASAAAVVVMLAAVGRSAAPRYDVSRVATLLKKIETDGHAIAHAGRYRGEYQFAGRLAKPLEVIQPEDVDRWFSRHPDGWVVVYSSRSLALEPEDELRHDFRGGVVAVRHRETGK
jgi:4-amino-4-deoxy-L-arabinose transferase-like glycosyltransferase